jgi:hypothetical protein
LIGGGRRAMMGARRERDTDSSLSPAAAAGGQGDTMLHGVQD